MGQKWEYRMLVTGRIQANGPGVEQKINDIGQQGWELVSVLPVRLGTQFIFKRPIEPDAPGDD